jgi:hypothetical protein
LNGRHQSDDRKYHFALFYGNLERQTDETKNQQKKQKKIKGMENSEHLVHIPQNEAEHL